MSDFRILNYAFDHGIEREAESNRQLSNWPVVYLLHRPAPSNSSGPRQPGLIYIGESLNFIKRMKQHLKTPEKQQLKTVALVLSEKFHKSACLDLESKLIQLAAGDASNQVLNQNVGILDSDYYNRSVYRRTFDEIFEQLRHQGLFQRSIPEIVNSELFKLSPFKALNYDQAIAAEDIMEGLAQDLADNANKHGNVVIVEGDPGTGKTVIAIYLMKLLSDIANCTDDSNIDADTMFSEFFVEGNRELFQNRKIALVVPQQSLRKSIENVFKQTPGLDKSMVHTAFTIAESPEIYDVVLVDEAHRLNRLAAQSVGAMTKRFKDINQTLFHGEKPDANQLDWLKAKARNLILMYDSNQTIRPADAPKEVYSGVSRTYHLTTQMRSAGGNDYIEYIKRIFSPYPPDSITSFGDYEVGLFRSPAKMIQRIYDYEQRDGLARIVAGYAWEWVSKKNPELYDIDLGEGVRLKWNTTAVDWVNSPNSINESGSIHTIQGYDLNYAGVIIGRDIGYDPERQCLFVRRDQYFDKAGKRNNNMLNITTTDEMLLEYISNIYFVLLTRGIRGTFIHAVDPLVSEYLTQFFHYID
ncbi:DUF2075 domain-containing protein [Corynebacterium canis]|uniref:DUF2075 domain-containing protein n=1 Tax=Corynebacterium canis TaxID=679663 RepID=A0A5C5US35_9CORY|nr:DUF2075 domain-containing protein [Corynebacterium canis]TWT28569.1 DUF2075 domain-containing protein [Corynebacterium canis]WJY75841.1 GIY-YIG catalytic domain protein [Corynebacterium canis]